MKKKIIGFVLAAALMLGGGAAQAQLATPAASPAASVTQKVGLTDVSVAYSRPSLKGRTLGADLAPYGKLWRTGANASTKIKFSDDVTIQGNKIPAGEYALYTIPGENEWTIILHKNTKYWGDGGKDYDKSEELARFNVKAEKNPRKIESFTILFSNLKNNAADVELLWGNAIAAFTIQTDVDAKVMAQIQEKVINGTNVTPGMYAAAASYYLDANKDLKQAAEWIKKANEAEPRFYWMHTQAKIQAQLKNYKEAVKTAEKSIELAKKENNDDYVRMNEKAIAEWKKMK
ncbi:DUF2911 domain-containing protein [Botryobacter ruber]|uniref:DUF2911 domain-containing protein n=1 Tax=Botryobacter ruber TaxID=2171629 RepID=UPI000E0AADB3|nr:DUF2911 domain-containing protein [Botryobacter ruber]